MSLNQSVASLQLESDLLEKFGLNEFQPTELHIVALYGLFRFNLNYMYYHNLLFLTW